MSGLRDTVGVTGPGPDELQLDIGAAVLRMEQAWQEVGTPFGEHLLMRLATCDAPRLRRYLTPEILARMAAAEAGG